MKIEAAKRLSKTFDHYLLQYLEGDTVDANWVREVMNLKSKCPSRLYRLVIASKNPKLIPGASIRLNKLIMSASDKKNSAVYAGCSYHYDYETPLTNKVLVLAEIQNPVCLINFQQLLKFAKEHYQGKYQTALKRVIAEREYIIKGTNVRAVILHVTTPDYLLNGDFRLLK